MKVDTKGTAAIQAVKASPGVTTGGGGGGGGCACGGGLWWQQLPRVLTGKTEYHTDKAA